MASAKEFVMTSSKSPNAKSQLIGVQLGRALRLSEHSRAYQRGWNRLLMKRNNWKSFDLALRGLEFERAILVLIERPTTFSYFIPAMLNLAASDLPHARDRCKIIAMVFFNHARHLLTLGGWLLTLKALLLATTTNCNDRKSTS